MARSKRKCCKIVELTVGSTVHTFKDAGLVGSGKVLTISPCGRYVRVEKRYGQSKRWTKVYINTDIHAFRTKEETEALEQEERRRSEQATGS